MRSGLLSERCVVPDFSSTDPHRESRSESRFNGSEDHNDAEGRDASKVSWRVPHEDDSHDSASRFMRVFRGTSKRIFPLLFHHPLDFLSFGQKKKCWEGRDDALMLTKGFDIFPRPYVTL